MREKTDSVYGLKRLFWSEKESHSKICLFINEIWWLVFHYIILIYAMIVSSYKTFQFYFFIFSLSDPYYIMTCCYKQNEINVTVDKYLFCCITLINETFLISLFKKNCVKGGVKIIRFFSKNCIVTQKLSEKNFLIFSP